MKKSEKNALLKWAEKLTDEKLEEEYYKAVDDSLGSQTEDMYELGYDIRDIMEREKHEKYLCEKASVLGVLCESRGIKVWDLEAKVQTETNDSHDSSDDDIYHLSNGGTYYE